ncbi:cyanophycinase [Thalassotalea sp. PS06]|uniref:cyanophycinase n=1 Tax=Thalassotalea sp. PS06 TaxID=2594005 RepID=UPI00163D8299|nr:cyanophycinase [Thalassotalea sp. PS06]
MFLNFVKLPLILSIMMLSLVKSHASDERLYLVGGGIKTCASMSPQHCADQAEINSSIKAAGKPVKTSSFYQLTPKNIQLFASHWPVDELSQLRKPTLKLLNKAVQAKGKWLTRRDLLRALTKKDNKNIISQLPDRQYFMMLDALEVPMIKEGNRVSETVFLEQTRSPFSKEIYRTFVGYAEQKRLAKKASNAEVNAQQNALPQPQILVVTASARDTFEAVDFYLQAFTQVGAKVEWLPIDAAVNKAWQAGDNLLENCGDIESYRADIHGAIKRVEVYPDLAKQQRQACENPDLMVQKINNADGIFFNGGDQSFTVTSFKRKDNSDNQVLKAIRRQLEANRLVVGGTSAGTAVMAGNAKAPYQIPMITNGRSEVSMFRPAQADVLPDAGCQKTESCEGLLNDDLTYRSQGGIGLFPFGITDTHFSERGREGRLVNLLKQTPARFAFGVDEATALVVGWQEIDKPLFRIVGQGGVFIVQQSPQQSAQHNPQLGPEQVYTHYLTRDDVFTLEQQQLSVRFADWKNHVEAVQTDATFKVPAGNIFKQDQFQQTLDRFCRSGNNELLLKAVWENNSRDFQLTSSKGSQFLSGQYNHHSLSKDYCSYTRLLLRDNAAY